jgi:ketosteroid isomerase-like protein
MTRPVLGLVGLLTAACQAAAPGHKDAEQAIVAQERRALEQWAKGNPLGYLDVDADDVTYFDDIGAHSRVNGIGAMRTYLTSLKGRIPPHRYEMLDPKVQLYGDIGILTLRYEAYGADSQRLSRWKATSVYHRASDQWRIVHAHWSLVKDGEASRTSSP